jgi:hypothetical protein
MKNTPKKTALAGGVKANNEQEERESRRVKKMQWR